MAKRGPQSELNDRNWDDEDEPEEAGVFKQATANALQGRVIKKAKRRGAGEEGDGAKTTAFGGFGGLVKKNLDSGSSTPVFGLGSKTASTTDNKPFAGGFSFKPTSSSTTNDASQSLKTAGVAITSNVGFSTGIKSSASSSSSSSKDSSYLHALKDLNESVLAWIKQHVDKNPYIIMSPIFKDYDKYVASLESKKAAATTTTSSSNGSSSAFSSSVLGNRNNGNDAKTTATTPGPTISSAFAPTKKTDESGSNKDVNDKDTDTDGSTKATVNFGAASSASNGGGFKFSTAASTISTTNSGFNFGKAAAPSISSGFSFGSSLSSSTTTATAAPTTGFSFGSGGLGSSSSSGTGGGSAGGGFSFGALAAAKAATDKAQGAGGDDDEYVPPKPEVKEIKEDGSLYSKRCKLFYQKEGAWTERGVGNVHVKPLDGSNKTQLLIRADTNLGNILLNINVTSALPASRQGKNNVLLVCVPNPPLKEGTTDPKPISMLIRVKTAEEADELLATLEQRKALL